MHLSTTQKRLIGATAAVIAGAKLLKELARHGVFENLADLTRGDPKVPHATTKPRTNAMDKQVHTASEDSFPASDPPSFTPGHT